MSGGPRTAVPLSFAVTDAKSGRIPVKYQRCTPPMNAVLPAIRVLISEATTTLALPRQRSLALLALLRQRSPASAPFARPPSRLRARRGAAKASSAPGKWLTTTERRSTALCLTRLFLTRIRGRSCTTYDAWWASGSAWLRGPGGLPPGYGESTRVLSPYQTRERYSILRELFSAPPRRSLPPRRQPLPSLIGRSGRRPAGRLGP